MIVEIGLYEKGIKQIFIDIYRYLATELVMKSTMFFATILFGLWVIAYVPYVLLFLLVLWILISID